MEWEIIGPAEIRARIGRAFNPCRIVPHAEFRSLAEAAPDINPHLASPPAVEAIECEFVEVFLRRYVTYCARRHRFASMGGAVRLHREIATVQNRLRDAQSGRPTPPAQRGGCRSRCDAISGA